jgi:hypothetical protein
MTQSRVLANQPLEPVETLLDAVQPGLDSHLGSVLVGGLCDLPLLGRSRNEGRGDCRDDDGQEGDALEHHEGGDDPS